MSDYLKSIVRTAVPAVLGSLAVLLVAVLARWIGYDLDPSVALGLVTAATITLVFAVGRGLERSSVPLLAWIGRFLLTLGPDIGQPRYRQVIDVAPEVLAEIMYTAYGEQAGWRTYLGAAMPGWDGLTDSVRASWTAAAREAQRTT